MVLGLKATHASMRPGLLQYTIEKPRKSIFEVFLCIPEKHTEVENKGVDFGY